MGGSSAPAVHLSAAAPTEKDTPCAASCPREVSGRPAGAARTRSVHGVGVRRAAPGPRNGWNECTWGSLRAGFGSPRLPTAATPRPTPRRRPTSCPDEFGGSPRTPNLNGGGTSGRTHPRRTQPERVGAAGIVPTRLRRSRRPFIGPEQSLKQVALSSVVGVTAEEKHTQVTQHNITILALLAQSS